MASKRYHSLSTLEKSEKHAMPIYSGSHELYGKFSLRRRSADVLAEWLATQSYENDFDKRDARLWIERIAVTDDNEIELFESTRSSYRDVGQRIEFLGWLADQAENGQAFVQHVENGFQLTRFVVNRGVSAKETRSGKHRLIKLPRGTRAERNAEAALAKQQQEDESLSTDDLFHEILIREAKHRKLFFLTNGDAVLIALAAEQLRAASGEAITFVPDISALSVHEQAAVLQQCWDGIRMIVGCTLESEQINRVICEGKLNEALLYRLRNCEIDLRRARPFAG